MAAAIPPILVLLVTRPTSGVGRRMESILARLQAKEHGRARIGRVDADLQPELAQRLGVDEIPSVVLVKNRVPVDWLPGRATFDEIEQALAAQLESEPVKNPFAPGRDSFSGPRARVPGSSWPRDCNSGRAVACGAGSPKC